MHTINGIAIKTGDVLLKQSVGTASHNIIQIGQKIGGMSGGHSNIAHAAIYVGSVPGHSHAIAESVGGGLRFATPNPGSHYVWHVWHLSGNTELRHLAADIASNLVEKASNDAGFGSYSKGGATKSAFKSSDPNKHAVSPNLSGDMLNDFTNPNGNTKSFFCSNFVVLAYGMAAQILGLSIQAGINLNYKYSSPAEMQKYFSRNGGAWQSPGQLVNGF